MKTIDLYCIPYAGGSKGFFERWKQHMDSQVTICPVELAGRAARCEESPYSSFDESVEDVRSIITGSISSRPYLLFGHSMGGLIAFEAVRKMRVRGDPLPRGLIISGRRPPHIDEEKEQLHDLPLERLKEKMMEWGGTAAEFFKYPVLVKELIPVLRQDLRIIDSYSYIKSPPITVPISVFYGTSEMTAEELDSWKDLTTQGAKLYGFPGGHFYMNEDGPTFFQQLHRVIHASLAASPLLD